MEKKSLSPEKKAEIPMIIDTIKKPKPASNPENLVVMPVAQFEIPIENHQNIVSNAENNNIIPGIGGLSQQAIGIINFNDSDEEQDNRN